MNNADQTQDSLAVLLIKSMQKNKDTVKEETPESNRIDPCRSVLAVTARMRRTHRESCFACGDGMSGDANT